MTGLVALAVFACGGADASQHGSRSERWRTADRVGGVGELEWACRGGGLRVRFTARGGTTERVAVKIGPGVTADARLQSGNALELPLGDAMQHWRVERISESLPPVIVFSVEHRGNGCTAPSVAHRARAG
jgi:hypothetical protein